MRMTSFNCPKTDHSFVVSETHLPNLVVKNNSYLCAICGFPLIESIESNGLSLNERAVAFDTYLHIHMVQRILGEVIKELMFRQLTHDQTKLSPPEVELFAAFSGMLQITEFGTPEYKTCLDMIRPALLNHYRNSRHHPEHFARGVNDMNLIDIIEMICDWKASSLRTKNGDMFASIEKCCARFGIDMQLHNIITNTALWISKLNLEPLYSQLHDKP